jgi:outer membrane lipoprotein SlyB
VFAKITRILPFQPRARQANEGWARHTSGMTHRRTLTSTFWLLPVAVFALLAGCAATGPNSPSAKPVLYPNATLTRVGEAQAKAEVDGCMARASQAGLTPDQKSNEVGRRAGEGAATAGVASAVGALITGRSSDVLRAGAAGAAVGGSAGAVSGAFHNDKVNPVYRQFVQRCLQEKGFDVIGWN